MGIMKKMTREKITKIIQKAVEELARAKGFQVPETENIPVDYPKEAKFGDYSSSISYGLAMQNKFELSPVEIAKLLKPYLTDENIERVEVMGEGGYLNFFLKKEYLQKEIQNIFFLNDKYGSSESGKNKKVLIEYSSPNIAKSFGIGHLRSTIIGQAIYNLYRFAGWQCIGDNHLGDWGTQFGKLIFQIKNKNIDFNALTVADLEKLYVEFHQEAKENPVWEEKAREEFLKLDSGDKENYEIWEACRKISLAEFERIYNLLDVKIDNVLGESFFAKEAQKITQEIIDKNLGRESEGAYIIEFADKTVQVVRKSDGSSTYLTRDLAAIQYRLEKWQPEMIVYEVGLDQKLYFAQLFEIAHQLGWDKKTKFVYIGHGLIRSKDGKFSTRQGQTIHLEDVLEEAINLTAKMMEDSAKDKVSDAGQRQELAQMMGIGAIKYNDLAQQHSQDIIFDWSKILNLKGNSGPYVQYTYARCRSLLEKGNWQTFSDVTGYDLLETERQLCASLLRFPDVCDLAQKTFSPNLLCNYIFDLCQRFNSYYDQTPIATAPDETARVFRLNLVYSISQVIKNTLGLLGLKAPVKI